MGKETKFKTVQLTNDVNNEMLMRAALIRGIILNALTFLERTIDVFLSSHFSDSIVNSDELLGTVFATKFITFESKRMIFNCLIGTHHKAYKEKHIKNIHSDLDKFNQHRNVIAHCVVDVSKDAHERYSKTNQVTFLKFDKKKKEEIYSIEVATKIAEDIHNFIQPVEEIIRGY